MLTISDYNNHIYQSGFQEYPEYYDGNSLISDFIKYGEADLNLKIYLNQLILCRSFYGTYTAWHADVKWSLSNFFNEYQEDLIKPGLTKTIKHAAHMIMANDPFIQGTIATTFFFPIIEFYSKYKLGFRPMEFNFFDREKTKEYLKGLDIPNKKRDLSVKTAIEQLKKKDLLISNCLREIDDFTTTRLSTVGIPSNNWTVHGIGERLNLARNAMLHGEIHCFYDKGEYLLLLYSLFHLCDLKESVV